MSHSPIGEHLKLAETETVSSPPFRDIGPPTHLLGVGRGNLTNSVAAGRAEAREDLVYYMERVVGKIFS